MVTFSHRRSAGAPALGRAYLDDLVRAVGPRATAGTGEVDGDAFCIDRLGSRALT